METTLSSFLSTFLLKYKEKTLNWADARHFLEYHERDNWESFFNQIGNIRYNLRQEKKELKIYTPGKNFPSISVTDKECELHCEHCDRKYLSYMAQAGSKEKFINILNNLMADDCIGALVSGGCTSDGKVPILKYFDIIEKFKSQNKFHLNAHVGLVDFTEAMLLKKIGIDTVSYDFNLDPNVIQSLFHLDLDVEDYIVSYMNLVEAGLNVVPHILIGANFGKLGREIDVLKILDSQPPNLIVYIAMMPPKDNNRQPISPFHILDSWEIAKFFVITKYFFPNTELSLGCMRPRGKSSFDIEHWSVLGGATRMEIPSQKTIDWLNNEAYSIQYFGACCSIPSEFEPFAAAHSVRGDLKNPGLLPHKKL